MNNLKKYGKGPFKIAVIHGGPGAAGEMAPVARELSAISGILEPLQTTATLEGQVAELFGVLQDNAKPPVTLIGSSWGAWLSFIFAARHPTLVKKLILVGSPPFEEVYAADILKLRLSRLNAKERQEVVSITVALNEPAAGDTNALMARFGKLMSKSDSYDPLPVENEILEFRFDIFLKVWQEADSLRRSGGLLEMGKKIQCPVAAIHGDYDPHPYRGVKEPLARVLTDFRFLLLEHCGHHPWVERQARDEFYNILKREIA